MGLRRGRLAGNLPSAEHLAEDLRRYLTHRPVNARPDSPGYRAAKFIRRNRVSVAVAGAATAAVAGLAGYAAYQAHAGRQRIRKVADAERVLKRELESAYGSPGDFQTYSPEAVRTYSALVEIAKTLWEADSTDTRALSDYGAAQLGLGIALPTERMAEKHAALERARAWLADAVRRNPGNPQLRQQLDAASAALAALARGSTPR